MSSVINLTTVAGSAASSLAQRAQTLPAVCPTAPPGMQAYQDQVVGWVKWGVIGFIIVAALVSIGMIAAGKIFSMPHASSRGAIGVAVSVVLAILFVTIIGLINGVLGSGC